MISSTMIQPWEGKWRVKKDEMKLNNVEEKTEKREKEINNRTTIEIR